MAAWMQASAAPIGSALTVVALVLVASCRQVVGVGNPDPPPRCTAPAFTAAASCDSCLIDRCCAELDGCHGDVVCSALLDCVAGCADDACRAACESKTKLTETSAALFACQASRCESECGLSCGGAGAPITSCKACGSSCCAEGTAFRADLDGQRLRACRAACATSDVGCREACANAHATGADLERTARECVTLACGVVGQWSCVGTAEVRKADAPSLVLTFRAADVQTLAPLAGVTVKGCSSADLTCNPAPFGSAITDANGVAKITVTLSSQLGSDAYAGFLEAQRAGYPTHLLFFHPALTADAAVGINMVPLGAQTQIEQLTGMRLAPDRGAVIAQSYDCGHALRSGVSFRADTADTASRTFYLRSASEAGGAPFDFQASATTEIGVGGIFNVPSGPLTITARAEDLCLDVWTATLAIRPGALSVVAVTTP